MDFTKALLPETIEVSGKHYQIQTGHSYWFLFSQIMGRDKKYVSDFDYLYTDEKPEDGQVGVDALLAFYYEKKELPRSSGDDDGEIVLDYELDADLIYAALMQCYGVDLFDKQIHWHKVRALIAGLHETKLNEIMGYRCAKPGKNKELSRMKEIWRLPRKLSAEDKEAMERFNAQFNC